MSEPSDPAPHPLVFVELLAGPDRRLGALRWHVRPATAAPALDWLRSPALAELAAALPCAWPRVAVAGWPAEHQAAVRDLGHPLLDAHDTPAGGTPWPAQARWCQGDWYLAPPAKPNVAQAASRQRALQLLQMVTDDADTHALEDVFRHDAALSYQLLRLVNSVAVGSRREITSFGQAILMLGRQQLKRWLNLLLFAARDDDERSAMLMAHVSLRARGMELLAQATGLDRSAQDQAFMTGMFSMLGVLFGTPLVEMLRTIRVPDALHAALVDRQGELGPLLTAWEAVERHDADATAHALAPWGVGPDAFNTLLLQACGWMLHLTDNAPGHGPAA
ncbi:EAL and HDOD domain-containing protein [Aquabacterium sp. A08]|uniref:EAL and HDOD domain-containing protein n=1 Tax=Aquabacterium sp. A08 TaxID=2718532 RepID=UPI0014201CC1|nr:HDOD domain-containing protein [Aquabacterium sp. A08]NIC42319.1 HDOD domain-containing protein [Aquabacterium sp. A08]